MVGILVISHGRLAAELLVSLEHVTGAPPAAAAICLGPDEDFEAIRLQIAQAVSRLDDGTGVLIFSDLFGGVTSDLAFGLLKPDSVELIAGVNLPMLIRASAGRNRLSLFELAKEVQLVGRSYIATAVPAAPRTRRTKKVAVEPHRVTELLTSLDRCAADLTMLRSLLRDWYITEDDPPGIGHNRAPRTIPEAADVIDDGILAAEILKQEVTNPAPADKVLQLCYRLLVRVRALVKAVAKWGLKKADRFVDGAIDSIAKSAGTAVLLAAVLGQLDETLSDLLPRLEELFRNLVGG